MCIHINFCIYIYDLQHNKYNICIHIYIYIHMHMHVYMCVLDLYVQYVDRDWARVLLRDKGSDSEDVNAPLMPHRTYLARPMGPFPTLQPPRGTKQFVLEVRAFLFTSFHLHHTHICS